MNSIWLSSLTRSWFDWIYQQHDNVFIRTRHLFTFGALWATFTTYTKSYGHFTPWYYTLFLHVQSDHKKAPCEFKSQHCVWLFNLQVRPFNSQLFSYMLVLYAVSFLNHVKRYLPNKEILMKLTARVFVSHCIDTKKVIK